MQGAQSGTPPAEIKLQRRICSWGRGISMGREYPCIQDPPCACFVPNLGLPWSLVKCKIRSQPVIKFVDVCLLFTLLYPARTTGVP